MSGEKPVRPVRVEEGGQVCGKTVLTVGSKISQLFRIET